MSNIDHNIDDFKKIVRFQQAQLDRHAREILRLTEENKILRAQVISLGRNPSHLTAQREVAPEEDWIALKDMEEKIRGIVSKSRAGITDREILNVNVGSFKGVDFKKADGLGGRIIGGVSGRIVEVRFDDGREAMMSLDDIRFKKSTLDQILGSLKGQVAKEYASKCYRCKREIRSYGGEKHDKCNWYICACGACGCGFKRE